MRQMIEATYEDGVFKPDQPPALSDSTRVRLVVEPMTTEPEATQRSWAILEQLWQQSTFDSHGDRLTREHLHERG